MSKDEDLEPVVTDLGDDIVGFTEPDDGDDADGDDDDRPAGCSKGVLCQLIPKANLSFLLTPDEETATSYPAVNSIVSERVSRRFVERRREIIDRG